LLLWTAPAPGIDPTKLMAEVREKSRDGRLRIPIGKAGTSDRVIVRRNDQRCDETPSSADGSPRALAHRVEEIASSFTLRSRAR